MKKSKNKVSFKTSMGNTITITCKYPKENPVWAIESISDALRHIGVLDQRIALLFTRYNLTFNKPIKKI